MDDSDTEHKKNNEECIDKNERKNRIYYMKDSYYIVKNNRVKSYNDIYVNLDVVTNSSTECISFDVSNDGYCSD